MGGLSKIAGRARLVAENSLYMMLPGISNLLFSLLVISRFGPGVWGSIVAAQLYLYIFSSILSWGNREYMQLAFSTRPAEIKLLFNTSLASRLLLFIPVLVTAFLLRLPPSFLLHLGFWVLCRYVSQSGEAIISYERRFRLCIWAELSALGAALLLFLAPALDPQALVLWCLSAAQLIRALVLLWGLRNYFFSGLPFRFSLLTLREAFPFALLAFTGLVQSRIDILSGIRSLAKAELAFYQVLTGYLLVLQSVSSYIFQPFLKNFYRSGNLSRRRLQGKLFLAGLLVASAGVPVILLVLKSGYHFTVSLQLVLLAFLYVMPPFLYLPAVYSLYKRKKTWIVTIINITGIILLSALVAFAQRLGWMSPDNLLALSVLHQFIILSFYLVSAHGTDGH